MAEFSLDIDKIENEVNDTIKVEQEKLENSNLKTQADNNAVAIFDADLNDPSQRENILKPFKRDDQIITKKSSIKYPFC